MDTTKPLWCEKTPDLATTTYCYYPSQEYLDLIDYANITPLIFLGTIIFFIVSIFLIEIFKR